MLHKRCQNVTLGTLPGVAAKECIHASSLITPAVWSVNAAEQVRGARRVGLMGV